MPYNKILGEDYGFPFKGEDKGTRTSWYMVGIVIGFLMSFIAFLLFFLRHTKINFKRLLHKT